MPLRTTRISVYEKRKIKKQVHDFGKRKKPFRTTRTSVYEKRKIRIFFIGVTGGYNGLHGLTGGYNGVTKDFRNFSLRRTFPNTLSWSILHKNKS